jgi:hypothetical protein
VRIRLRAFVFKARSVIATPKKIHQIKRTKNHALVFTETFRKPN